jgi:nucleoside-diphosphate-sugar epimerase
MVWKDKRVLVTGSSGVIGRVLVDLLQKAGAIVLSVDIQPNTTGVMNVQVDLAKEIPDTLYEFQPQIVFHLAAVFERTVEERGYWKTSFENNVLLSHNLLEAMVDAGSVEQFIFASSYLIYDPSQYSRYSGVPGPCFLKETDNIRPRNLVGMAKYLFEQELDFVDTVDNHFKTISARIFRVYGRGSQDIISRWVRSALSNELIDVFNKYNTFDYIFADDVAEGLLQLAQSDARGVVNLGSGEYASILRVSRILALFLPNIRIASRESIFDIPTYNVEYSAADMMLFNRLTGWWPTTTLKRGIAKIIEYEQERMINV